MKYDLRSVIKNFNIDGHFLEGRAYGSGHIHDTFLIRTAEGNLPDYLLQKINHHVFRNIPQLMSNIERVTKHIQRKIMKDSERRTCLTSLIFIPATDGKYYHQDPNGDYWRVSVFIPESRSFDVVSSPEKAYEGGVAFGRFLADLEDLPVEWLHETIPDFHNIERRLSAFHETVKKDSMQRTKEVQREIDFVAARAEEMKCIHHLAREGKIPRRITHNDTKFNNILFDREDNLLCVIDLDTVMPGFVHYDFGDAIRTAANTGVEDEKDLSKISMDIRLYEAFSDGFLKETRAILTKTEIDYLAFSAKLLTFMIGLRFLTDFIDGDNYYKIHHPFHNLQRARAQFKLLQSMDEQYDEMQSIIERIVRI